MGMNAKEIEQDKELSHKGVDCWCGVTLFLQYKSNQQENWKPLKMYLQVRYKSGSEQLL